VDCMEKIVRCKTQGARAKDLAGAYPDAQSQRIPTAVVHAAREVMQRNSAYFDQGKPPIVTAGFTPEGITVHDAHSGNQLIYKGTI